MSPFWWLTDSIPLIRTAVRPPTFAPQRLQDDYTLLIRASRGGNFRRGVPFGGQFQLLESGSSPQKAHLKKGLVTRALDSIARALGVPHPRCRPRVK